MRPKSLQQSWNTPLKQQSTTKFNETPFLKFFSSELVAAIPSERKNLKNNRKYCSISSCSMVFIPLLKSFVWRYMFKIQFYSACNRRLEHKPKEGTKSHWTNLKTWTTAELQNLGTKGFKQGSLNLLTMHFYHIHDHVAWYQKVNQEALKKRKVLTVFNIPRKKLTYFTKVFKRWIIKKLGSFLRKTSPWGVSQHICEACRQQLPRKETFPHPRRNCWTVK